MKDNKKKLDKEISVLTLKIKRGTWELFKNLVPSSKTLNDAVVNLILKEIQINSRPATKEEIEELNHPKKGRPENKYSAKD